MVLVPIGESVSPRGSETPSFGYREPLARRLWLEGSCSGTGASTAVRAEATQLDFRHVRCRSVTL